MSQQIDVSKGNDGLKELRKVARMEFWQVVKEGTMTLIDKAPTMWSGPEERFYRSEKKILSKHVEPIYWGTVVSLFLFATFRLSGSRFYSRFRETYYRKSTSATATSNSTSSPTQKKKPDQWKSYLDKQAEKVDAARKEVVDLPSDIIISLTCGVSSVLLLSRQDVMKKDFIEAPLQPGKSAIYDTFCPAMESAYRKHVDPRIVTKEDIQNDDTIFMFLSFVKNCRTRAEYIAYQEQLGTVKRPNVIPYPGLEGVRR